MNQKVDLTQILNTIENTRIGASSIHGYGLFSCRRIPAGRLLATLDGQRVPWSLYQSLGLCDEWNALSPDWLLVRPYKTMYSFINHCRQPNALLELHPSEDRLMLFARADLEAGDEITLDYRNEPLPDDYVNGHGKSYL